jgi:hypothetical protein
MTPAKVPIGKGTARPLDSKYDPYEQITKIASANILLSSDKEMHTLYESPICVQDFVLL